MPDVTPIFGWTVPVATDEVADWPSIATEGITDIENSMVVDESAKVNSSAPSTYPQGVSLMLISNSAASSGGWPGTAATLMTMRRTSNDTYTWQMKMDGVSSGGPSHVWMRQGTTTGWGPWMDIAGAGHAMATASGTVTFSSVGVPTTRTVSFPAGRFTGTPNVVATTHDRSAVIAVQGISSTGFTMALGNNGGGSTLSSTQDWFSDWIAMQDNS